MVPTMTKNRKKGGGSRKSAGVDSLIINSHKATGSTTTVVMSDIAFRRQNFNLVQSPPRSLSNQIHWAQISSDTQLSLSTLAATETNFAFTISQFNGFSSLLQSFDQYCIYSITCTFAATIGGTVGIRLYTALDYDNVTLIGKAALLAFSTYQYTSLSSDGSNSLVRYLKPCIATQVTNSSLLPAAGGVARTWIDSSFSTILHYGLRCIIDTVASSTSGTVEVSFTALCGFRNNN